MATEPQEPGGLLIDIDPEDVTGSVTITQSAFRRNQASLNGGAISASSAPLTIEKVSFFENMSSDENISNKGGAIHFLGPGDIMVHESYFMDNQADEGSGGALSIDTGVLELSASYIANNTAGGGGAVHGAGSLIRIVDSQLAGNRVTGLGGGVALQSTLGSAAFFTMVRSLVGANTSNTTVGGIWLNNTHAEFENATVFFNFSGTSFGVSGSGVQANGESPVNMRFSTVVGNQGPAHTAQVSTGSSLQLTASVIDGGAPACDAQDVSTSGGYNVVRDKSCLSDGVDNLVAPSTLNLADYVDGIPGVLVPNGITPLVGRVPLGACSVATDARGVTRPQGTDCDTGAAERIGGGVGGPPAALTFGFDQPGTSVDAVVARLKSLGIKVTPADPDNLIGLTERLRKVAADRSSSRSGNGSA